MGNRISPDYATPHSPQPLTGAPAVLWLTGISGAGKTTIASHLKQLCLASGHAAAMLDGDELRGRLNADLGFSESDRAENVRRIAEVAALMADAGLLVIVSCISPLASFRLAARDIVGAQRFVEVYIDTPIDVAEARDPKGLYRLARAGKITGFTGLHAAYEPPREPAIRIDTTVTGVEAAAERLLGHYQAMARAAATRAEAGVCG
ncbi:adenylyl-sulfate kinase [Chromobacterium subtsugae]|uniref:Adenylyl-sulfate kinase n=1 Tax=Chromobacterium subtsugae TaxID=251747 RepID=A0ABS7F987_9NEIS|nr:MULTISPECIES: adenylyl-sulfate kinase [Chromobacterium]MBW7564902.1 adenylyl-sulfate kinase [Chromobacterium subtsugae]MBW8286571.1 adenylyl-sulfate kinase [Chromobacterium subtsugae]WSE91387.1 adenylyl-sulfate kinase [Chromobacterium subtsugae]WVH59762.1 adenylyl-sulfate kinase [Chromobacterium subtsugae]